MNAMPGCVFASVLDAKLSGKFLSSDNEKNWIYVEAVTEDKDTGVIHFEIRDCERAPSLTYRFPRSKERSRSYLTTYGELMADGWLGYVGTVIGRHHFAVCSASGFWVDGYAESRKYYFACIDHDGRLERAKAS